ncbi:hypothetical protein SUDANB121_03832 [Nocardiopsis dassonvillei]|uniref:hypothetical protein n=1 Tax=Nocardiopsis dassonvillei TaxID=2014 RepID=UPI003F57C3E3
MKFDLVEPGSWDEQEPERAPLGPPEARFSDRTFPMLSWLTQEEQSERLKDGFTSLEKRLTRSFERLRPALSRMEAAVIRAQQEMAGTGHVEDAELPEGFRAERFSGVREGAR